MAAFRAPRGVPRRVAREMTGDGRLRGRTQIPPWLDLPTGPGGKTGLSSRPLATCLTLHVSTGLAPGLSLPFRKGSPVGLARDQDAGLS